MTIMVRPKSGTIITDLGPQNMFGAFFIILINIKYYKLNKNYFNTYFLKFLIICIYSLSFFKSFINIPYYNFLDSSMTKRVKYIIPILGVFPNKFWFWGSKEFLFQTIPLFMGNNANKSKAF